MPHPNMSSFNSPARQQHAVNGINVRKEKGILNREEHVYPGVEQTL